MYISLSTTGMDTIVHVWAEVSSSSRFNTVAVSTMVSLAGECTALWASQATRKPASSSMENSYISTEAHAWREACMCA